MNANFKDEASVSAAARGAHAAGVPFSAARRKPRTTNPFPQASGHELEHEGLGEPPKPAREPRALPAASSAFRGLQSRRSFLRTSAVAATSLALPRLRARAAAAPAFSFFVLGDTHFLADKDDPARMSPRSLPVCSALVDTFNRLPGTEIPAAARAGSVTAPSGVIHAGDLIDSGDKNGPGFALMQETEWANFAREYGLNGKDGRLKFPVYEIHGNHDSPHGGGLVLKNIAARNPRRPGVKNISANGLHYSWNWGNVHFVNLGLIVGTDRRVTRKRRYAALDSLEFLVGDLAKNVGTSGRPIVLTHHVDVARYTGPCVDNDELALKKEWDPCDVRGFHEALKTYNITAIFYGHTHVRNVFLWDGFTPRA